MKYARVTTLRMLGGQLNRKGGADGQVTKSEQGI